MRHRTGAGVRAEEGLARTGTGRGTRKAVAGVTLLTVAGLCAWTWLAYHGDIRQARQRVAGASVAETPCGAIEYAVAGEGLPVLAVHGAGGGYDQGLLLADGLAARGFRVIAMSRFGYLGTPFPADASAQAQADAHACLLDALGIERAAVIGASAGAPSSVQLALRHPGRVTALVLLVPALYLPRENAPSLRTPSGTDFLFETALKSDFVLWAALRLARETMLRAILATPPEVVEEADPAARQRVDVLLSAILPVTPRRLGLMNDAVVTSHLERYALEEVAAPTLVVSAEDDLFGTWDVARYTADGIPNARFTGYPRGGHVLVGHQDALMAEIESFLRAH